MLMLTDLVSGHAASAVLSRPAFGSATSIQPIVSESSGNEYAAHIPNSMIAPPGMFVRAISQDSKMAMGTASAVLTNASQTVVQIEVSVAGSAYAVSQLLKPKTNWACVGGAVLKLLMSRYARGT